jgi:hypoxanthine-DNA glycosylase
MKKKATGNPKLVGLAPIIDTGARVLVLGSFPSAASIAASCYYAHPRNQFWPILAMAWEEAFPAALPERGAWALAHGLAIWDSLGACVRPGSLDENIRDAKPNDISGFLAAWPRVERLLANGTASARFLRLTLKREGFALTDTENPRRARISLPGGRTIEVFFLPSTSPVPSREFRKMEDKLPLWLEALSPLIAFDIPDKQPRRFPRLTAR